MRYMEMEYHGHCLCGGCSIVIKTLTQLKQFTCNCADCQHTSGSLHSTNIFPLAQDVSLVGDVHEYNSRASSGNVVTRSFCGTCGSPLAHRSKAFGHHIAIQTGNLPDFRPIPHGLPPSPATTRPTALTPSPPPRHYMLAASPLSLSETHEPTSPQEAVLAAEMGDVVGAQSPDVMSDCQRDDSSVEGSPLGKRKAEIEEEMDSPSRKKSPSRAGRIEEASPSGSAGSQPEVPRSRRSTTGKR